MIDFKIIMNVKIWYRVESEDQLVLRDSFENDLFYRELPYLNLSEKPVIIDVGAHIGTFSLYSAIKFPAARIFCFEASQETFSILTKNIEDNALSESVFALHKALNSGDSEVRLYHNAIDGNWGHTISKEISSSYELVDGISLPTFLSTNRIDVVDLIKFNCEGAEFDIIMNCPDAVLSKIGCAIILYHDDLSPSDFSHYHLERKLIQSGFACQYLHQTKDRGWIIAVNRKDYSPFLFKWLSRIKRRLPLWRRAH